MLKFLLNIDKKFCTYFYGSSSDLETIFDWVVASIFFLWTVLIVCPALILFSRINEDRARKNWDEVHGSE